MPRFVFAAIEQSSGGWSLGYGDNADGDEVWVIQRLDGSDHAEFEDWLSALHAFNVAKGKLRNP